MGRTYRKYDPEEYRRRKLQRYRKTQGVEPFIDAGPAQAHIARLQTRMSVAEIARQSGVTEGTIRAHARGNALRQSIRPDNARKILAVTFGPGDLTREERLVGAVRMVRGVIALGFTAKTLASVAGGIMVGDGPCSLINMLRGSFYPSITVYENLLRASEKLETCNPQDLGITPRGSNVNKSRARNWGWAPLTAWDYDTIHVEESCPDWTGACGTMAGVRLHRKDGQAVSVCRPCTEARAQARLEKGNGAA